MGLDVVLYRFATHDTDAVLNVARRVEDYWAKQSQQHDHASESYPSKSMRAGARGVLGPVCEFYGLPVTAHECITSLATQVEYGWEQAPASPFNVGSWDDCFSSQMSQLTKLFCTPQRIEYEFFPEAVNDPELIKPNWSRSRDRIEKRLTQLNTMTHEHQDFLLIACVDPVNEFAQIRDGLKVMAETMDCVLRDSRPNDFLLG